VSRADLGKEPEEVSAMFDGVARRYDLLNDLLSLGRTKVWRKAATSIIGPKSGMRILDIAAGTGSSSRPLADAGADVIPLDFSTGMLAAGRKRHPDLPFTQGDALALSFQENEFDVATISFGLRNTSDPLKALQESLRVLKPGGRAVVVEFSQPTNNIFRFIYLRYLMRALPAIAKKVSSNPDAYVYLAESILAWPNQTGLGALMAEAGFEKVQWKNLTFGIVAIHTGHKDGPKS
jgi:demethylmenaquinone methyltransferase / 2-methoxy-6-polyprenyl-1,4-benzoquinol methylase